jgi:transcriptional regulator with XRE-family HTH domain
MLNAKKVEFIEELKQLRTEKGITYQQIADETEKNGEAVSLSTIKHVFSDKYNHDHDWKNVLRPIANVLMPPSEDDDLETRALQTRIELNKEIIKQLQDRLAAKEDKFKSREQFLIEQIDFYKEQIKTKDEQIRFRDKQIKRYEDNIDRKDAELRRLYTERE